MTPGGQGAVIVSPEAGGSSGVTFSAPTSGSSDVQLVAPQASVSRHETSLVGTYKQFPIVCTVCISNLKQMADFLYVQPAARE